MDFAFFGFLKRVIWDELKKKNAYRVLTQHFCFFRCVIWDKLKKKKKDS